MNHIKNEVQKWGRHREERERQGRVSPAWLSEAGQASQGDELP